MMKSRIFALSAASIVLAAWPAAAAFAVTGDGEGDYTPPTYCTAKASPSKLKAGGSTTVTVTTTPNSKTTLTISSKSSSSTKTTTSGSNGTASFSFTLNKAGDYTVSAQGEEGDVCALSLVVTKLPPVVAGAEETDDDPADTLPMTGSTTAPYLVTAGALAAAGIATVALARRRRTN